MKELRNITGVDSSVAYYKSLRFDQTIIRDSEINETEQKLIDLSSGTIEPIHHPKCMFENSLKNPD